MELPPSPNRSASDAKRHSRNASYQRSLPRRSTKGPLDEPDDPLTTTTTASTIPLPTSPPKPPPRPLITHPTPHYPPPSDEKDLSFLLHPSIFHPLPPPLFPPTSSKSSEIDHHTLATSAATRLTTAPPPSNTEIFTLWYARLTSLLHLRHHTIAARETGVFEDVTSPFWHVGGENVIPWDLRVLVVRLAERGRVVPGLYALGREARSELKQLRRKGGSANGGVQLWKRRLKGLGVAVAEALMEEGDAGGAVAVLRGLMTPRKNEGEGEGEGRERDKEVKRMLVLAYCKTGDVGAARRVWEEGEGSAADLEPVVRICEGDFEGAAGQMSIQRDDGGVRNNLAVTRFYQGDIGEAVGLLEEMVDGDEGEPSRESIFNLATCYELTGENGVRERKEGLVRRVGEKGGGALSGLGRADFKL